MKVVDERKGSGKVGCIDYIRVRLQQSANLFSQKTKANNASIHSVCRSFLGQTMKVTVPYSYLVILPSER